MSDCGCGAVVHFILEFLTTVAFCYRLQILHQLTAKAIIRDWDEGSLHEQRTAHEVSSVFIVSLFLSNYHLEQTQNNRKANRVC